MGGEGGAIAELKGSTKKAHALKKKMIIDRREQQFPRKKK